MITFSSEEILKVQNFANNIDTDFYESRNQFNQDKKKLDQQIGKFGELAVYHSLKSTFEDLSYPDFEIYTKSKKSFDCDLKTEFLKIHVKSQATEQAQRFGESWIFQNTDKEIFKSDPANQYVAFVNVNLPNKTAEVKKILSLELLHKKNLFKLPVLEKLQKMNKLAVYYKDIKFLNSAL